MKKKGLSSGIGERPKASDYYDTSDPRGMSSSEHADYMSAVKAWENSQEVEEEPYTPYCKICDTCGEDGCCTALACEQHEDGKYCVTYLRDLKFGYLMSKDLYELIADDPKYKDRLEKIYDENYEIIYKD